MVKDQVVEIHSKCEKALSGIQYREPEKKNAFLYPDEEDAIFPQYVPAPIIDLRSNTIPGAGT